MTSVGEVSDEARDWLIAMNARARRRICLVFHMASSGVWTEALP